MIPQMKPSGITILLHNIRSVYNVGSIFRTADAVGVERVLISGHTPAPVDRFGRNRADIAKVALGAEKTVSWEQFLNAEDVLNTIHQFKREGGTVIALEQDKTSVEYRSLAGKACKQKVLLIVGNEVGGVSRELLDCADIIAEIPMNGKKESLNVSVATGVMLYTLIF